MIVIKGINGKTRYSTEINEGSKRECKLNLEADNITLEFNTHAPIAFALGDYCDIENEGRFELTELQNPEIDSESGACRYSLRFDAPYLKWQNKIFKYSPNTGGYEAEWNLTATLDTHAKILLDCLKFHGFAYHYNGAAYTVAIDSTISDAAKLITYSNVDMISALQLMAETWECDVWITDNIIHFGRCEASGTPTALIEGVNVVTMSSSKSSGTYATRLYAFGSTRNLPTNYRPIEGLVTNGVIQKRLMLPEGTPYIDAYGNMTTEQIVEAVIVLDDIYPRTNGTIDEVTTYTDTTQDSQGNDVTETFYRFTEADKSFNFSADYILAGETLGVIFQSGRLNGMTFDVNFNPKGAPEKKDDKWNPEAQLFEIIANENYGRKLPDSTLYPEKGDKYVLFGWDSTKIANLGLVAKAEQELLSEARKVSEKYKKDPNTYDCTLFSDYAYGMDANGNLDKSFAKQFYLGDVVTLHCGAFFGAGSYTSRVIGFEYPLDKPFDSPKYTIGESAAYSKRAEMQQQIDTLTMQGKTYTSTSGGSSVYVISTKDATAATDRNVYSALRTRQDFICKKSNDRTPFDLAVGGKFTAEQGTQFGESFAEGISGFGGKIDKYGDGWLGGLHLRNFLEVPELRYNRTDVSIGNDWNAPGGGIIDSVVPDKDDDGNLLLSGTITLHLEDGEVGAVAVDDICQGIYHDSVNLGNNATADSDDSRGNFLFAGFHTVYFRITEIVETGRNSIFRYVLRPKSERWKTTFHPSSQMTFVGYGNFSNKERQTSRYSTRTYERYLKDVADWEFTENNIGAQFGNLSNLSVFGLDMVGYSAYLNNIYMTGRIEQIDANPLYMTLDYENDNFLAYGETKTIVCRVFRGWEDVTDRVVEWTVTRDTGSPQDDTAWQLKTKVKNFSGSIDICFTNAENDLGTNDYVMSTLFTFKATIGSGEKEETATYQLTI